MGRGKPLPEGEEGVVEEERGISLDRLSPKGLAGIPPEASGDLQTDTSRDLTSLHFTPLHFTSVA